MKHPTEETLLAWVDAELELEAADDVARHVALCAACTGAVTRLRETSLSLAGVLAAVDASEPERWSAASLPFSTVAEDGTAADPYVIPIGSRRAPRADAARSGASVWRWAAGILLVAGGASAAVIGGQRLWSGDGERTDGTAALPTSVEAIDDAAAVSVRPEGGAVRIALTGAGAGSRVDIVSGEYADARVTVSGVAAPHFSAAAGTIRADVQGAAVAVRIELPARLATGSVMIDGRTVATVRNGAITKVQETGGVEVNIQAETRMN